MSADGDTTMSDLGKNPPPLAAAAAAAAAGGAEPEFEEIREQVRRFRDDPLSP